MYIVSALAATKPADQTIKKVAVQHGFKTAPDGRFIIKAEDDESEQKKSKWTLHVQVNTGYYWHLKKKYPREMKE